MIRDNCLEGGVCSGKIPLRGEDGDGDAFRFVSTFENPRSAMTFFSVLVHGSI